MSTRRTVLVTGAARSGKSRFALRRAEALGPPFVFLATAEARDAEMASRIARHRAERGSGWRTVEEPRDVARALDRAAEGVVVLDCVTLWIANLMNDDPGFDSAPVVGELALTIESAATSIVLVTNEVGAGIVPESALARAFRDRVGEANATFAELADEVHLLVAGLPLRLK